TAARHCQALALIKLHHYGEAATRLEGLAVEPGAGDGRARAALLGQARNARMLEHEASRAYNAQSRALMLAPGDRDLLIDRALASALGEDYNAAEEDLTALIARNQTDIEALILRADARQALGNLTGARADAEAAVRNAPRSPDAWLQRGLVR